MYAAENRRKHQGTKKELVNLPPRRYTLEMQTRRTALATLLGAPALLAEGQTGNLPNVGLTADTGPTRSESGVGALMPWADVLWAVNYNSHTRTTGTGLGLYRIDEQLKTELRNDAKNQSENVMIVDLVRNDLGKSCVAGTVQVTELFGIYSFPTVHQMISTVEGLLKDDLDFVDALKNAFPMGSMTGAPKVRAMQLIEQYEKTKRGLYSGAVGYITPEGDFDFNVVIRSVLYNQKNQYLSFQVGGAIVADSVPEREYEECLVKATGVMRALGVIF